jgi:hypothetical protein
MGKELELIKPEEIQQWLQHVGLDMFYVWKCPWHFIQHPDSEATIILARTIGYIAVSNQLIYNKGCKLQKKEDSKNDWKCFILTVDYHSYNVKIYPTEFNAIIILPISNYTVFFETLNLTTE